MCGWACPLSLFFPTNSPLTSPTPLRPLPQTPESFDEWLALGESLEEWSARSAAADGAAASSSAEPVPTQTSTEQRLLEDCREVRVLRCSLFTVDVISHDDHALHQHHRSCKCFVRSCSPEPSFPFSFLCPFLFLSCFFALLVWSSAPNSLLSRVCFSIGV